MYNYNFNQWQWGEKNKGTTFCILVNAWLLVGSHHCSTDVMLSVTAGLSQSIVVDIIKLLQLVRGLFFFFLKLLPHHSPCKTYVQLRLREYLMDVIKFSRWKFIEISWKGVHLLKAGNKHSSGSWLDRVCTWGHTRPVLHGKRRAREQQIPMLKKKKKNFLKKYFGSSVVFQLLMHVISWAFVLFFSASLCNSTRPLFSLINGRLWRHHPASRREGGSEGVSGLAGRLAASRPANARKQATAVL